MTKKVNVDKLNSLIQNEVANTLAEVNKTKKSSTTKKAVEKPKAEPKAKVEEPKKVTTPKATTKKETKPKAETQKEKVTKEVSKRNQTQLIEQVVANREVKYIYPEDVNDTLSRKSWRQKVRNKLERLERNMFRIKDQNSKEYKAAEKEYNEYRKTVLKEVG